MLRFAIFVVCTIGAGLMHGRMTNRWGSQLDSNLAAQRISQPLPERVGGWLLKRESEMEASVVRLLQCPSYISRTYEHEQTGDVVSVFVLLGPPGPISVHTPEVCYSNHDFSISGERQLITIQDASGKDHTFWDVTMKSNGLEEASQRVLYGWSTGSRWEAAASPRYGFGGAPYLYKLQLAASLLNKRTSALDSDPTHDFLSQFLVQLNDRLVDSNTK